LGRAASKKAVEFDIFESRYRGLRMDRDYFDRRAEQERIAASLAKHPKAKQAHLELAERFERRQKYVLGSETKIEPIT
jgi:hypothetical protein